jgi:DNA helicase-2/ATP-dependent DNA helicase PcrA
VTSRWQPSPVIGLPSPVAERLARLDPEQRAAATAPPGPVLCVAPAGSGKTTTLVARVAWLVAGGVDPATILAITFNRRAAEELRDRIEPAVEPLGVGPGTVRVRTFHALGLEILRSTGRPTGPLLDRAVILRRLCPGTNRAARGRLDLAISRLKLDLGVSADAVAADPAAGPVARAFVAYERALAAAGGLDFDDLVVHALRATESDPALLGRWRTAAAHLLVDEVQDVDASQLQLALLLAAPANRIFLVGDDDQSIYGWRLADVRRVLGLAARLPGLRRIDLATNYRCPRPVVDRAVRLVSINEERFAKEIRPRDPAPGRLVLAPSSPDQVARAERVMATLPDDGGTRAILARTNRALLPAAAVALERGIAFRGDGINLLLDDARVDELLDRAAATPADWPPLRRLGALARRFTSEPGPPSPAPDSGVVLSADPTSTVPAIAAAPDEETTEADILAALLAWTARFPTLGALAGAIADARARLATLRRDDASLALATAHSTKGLEFDHVAVIDMDAGRFPSARALADAAEPGRALEEERRLAYVAWTRARRSLFLAFDPAAPSPFLAEAFEPAELEPGQPR